MNFYYKIYIGLSSLISIINFLRYDFLQGLYHMHYCKPKQIMWWYRLNWTWGCTLWGFFVQESLWFLCLHSVFTIPILMDFSLLVLYFLFTLCPWLSNRLVYFCFIDILHQTMKIRATQIMLEKINHQITEQIQSYKPSWWPW